MNFDQLKLLFVQELKKSKSASDEKTKKYIDNAYNKVLKILNTYHKGDEISTIEKINNLPITIHMKKKLIDLMKKPQTNVETYVTKNKEREEREKLKIDLINVLGIGTQKINTLLNMGLKSINQLKEKKYFDILNTDTQIIITYEPVRKIPNNDIKKIEPKLTNFLHATVELVGSYRRKMPYSKDIDILIKTDDIKIVDEYLEYLKKQFNNKIYIYAKGDDKVSLIIQPFMEKKIKYKMDIFRSSPETYYANLLYTTGPKEFNIKMRSKARKMGYLLNQNGLFKKTGNNIKKINKTTDTESDFFKYLDMSYTIPENRK